MLLTSNLRKRYFIATHAPRAVYQGVTFLRIIRGRNTINGVELPVINIMSPDCPDYQKKKRRHTKSERWCQVGYSDEGKL